MPLVQVPDLLMRLTAAGIEGHNDRLEPSLAFGELFGESDEARREQRAGAIVDDQSAVIVPAQQLLWQPSRAVVELIACRGDYRKVSSVAADRFFAAPHHRHG